MYKLGDEHAGYLPGCKRTFTKGEGILARVVHVQAVPDRPYFVKLSVDMDADLWLERFPLSDQDATYFVPFESENWTKVALGPVDNARDGKTEGLGETS